MTLLAESLQESLTAPAAPRVGPRGGRWVEAMPHLHPAQGGLSAVIPQLSAELSQRHGLQIELAAFDEAEPTELVPVLPVTRWPAGRLAWLTGTELRERFRALLAEADGVHVHGLWSAHAAISARAARGLGKPYVVSAHGMLEPWALAHKGWKKRLYSALVEKTTLDHAACLHALTLDEADDYRRFGCRAPVAVVPNAVQLPETIQRDLFLDMFPALRGKRILLFLGRLHPKKGVDLLLRAWAALAGEFSDAVLVLAGPDSENTRGSLEAIARENDIEGRVVFTGMLDSAMKWSALAAAACFLLPSHSEGQSIAILEALGMGLPVIVSDRCHMPEVRQAAAGWEITPDLAALTLGLKQFLSASATANMEMGKRGRQLVAEKFSWPVVARQMAELYAWVQGGARPVSFKLLEVGA